MDNSREALLKPKKIFTLKLSLAELIHLRDLFSISLPVDLKTTVSQSLAIGQGRQIVETKLWNKLVNLCKEGGIPLEEESPDFIITVTAPPELGVFEVASDYDRSSEQSSDSEEEDADGE
jgi:hypothetical protein